MAGNDEGELRAPRSWLLLRPLAAVMSLPLEYRWEFTRRHPYYLQFWQLARGRREHPSHDSQQREREQVASLILAGIGVAASAIPPDPQLGPTALGYQDLGAIWEGGAVAPATFRTLAHMLLASLPKTQRSQLGRLLAESSEFESDDIGHMHDIHERLATTGDPVWDSFPVAPVVSVNLQMPQRAIAEAIEKLVRLWKHDRNIPEQRRRDEKLAAYLSVWDAREGWAGSGYEGSRERTLRAIAQETGDPLATVISRYRTAFYYLSGHDYTPRLWINLMGCLKLSRHLGNAKGLVLRRPWRSPNLRPVAESDLLPGRKDFERPEFLQAGITGAETALDDLAMDIATLLDRGRSDCQIVEELEIRLPPQTANDLVAELRRRHESRQRSISTALRRSSFRGGCRPIGLA